MNTIEYTGALERFIEKMSSYTEVRFSDVSEASVELCNILRIGKAEINYYRLDSPQTEPYQTVCIFDCGSSQRNEIITTRKTAPDDKIAEYKFYPITGADSWSDDEKRRISVFASLLSTYNVKSRMISVANMLTYYDKDLDMYNLKHFQKYIGSLCRNGKIAGYAAAFFNLRRFSATNKRIGRENGTLVMKHYIGMFNEMLDDDELVCRAGGDNFVFLIAKEKLDDALSLIRGAYVPVSENYPELIKVSASIGVYIITEADCPLTPTDIMDKTALAFHVAKNAGKNNIVYFDEELLKEIEHMNYIISAFPKAMADKEFLVYYQPKIALDGCNITGAEALCRWMHDGRLISPAEFIPVLEQGNDICRLDFYVLDMVCQDIRRWLDTGKKVVKVSVNLSRRHLSDENLLEHIVEIIDHYDIPHQYIEIELTETTNEDEYDDIKRAINGLYEVGISTSVDDFGIGYSSFEMLKDLPWNVLKLDKSMLPEEDDENNQQKKVMFKHIVAMAQEMGLECIAEGVETKEQVQLLADNSCKVAQGFFFDKPLPVEEFETRLDDYSYEL